MKPTRFKPGVRLRCIEPTGRLKMGEIYTVAAPPEVELPTALLALREVPDTLFHPDRFTRTHGP